MNSSVEKNWGDMMAHDTQEQWETIELDYKPTWQPPWYVQHGVLHIGIPTAPTDPSAQPRIHLELDHTPHTPQPEPMMDVSSYANKFELDTNPAMPPQPELIDLTQTEPSFTLESVTQGGDINYRRHLDAIMYRHNASNPNKRCDVRHYSFDREQFIEHMKKEPIDATGAEQLVAAGYAPFCEVRKGIAPNRLSDIIHAAIHQTNTSSVLVNNRSRELGANGERYFGIWYKTAPSLQWNLLEGDI